MNQLEEGKSLQLDFTKIMKVAENCDDVIPVAVQNIDTKEVILLAFVNKIALSESIKTRKAVFWTTTNNKLWEKGKDSGNVFDLIEIYVNCEQNSLLYKVRPIKGGICHTKNKNDESRNCYYRKLDFDSFELENIDP